MPLPEDIDLDGGWELPFFDTPCLAPGQFALSCCCPCYETVVQRQRMLEYFQEDYVCCVGLCPWHKFLWKEVPRENAGMCIYAEACCCTTLAMSANRFLLQTRLSRKNTSCDECLLAPACCVTWGTWCVKCAGCEHYCAAMCCACCGMREMELICCDSCMAFCCCYGCAMTQQDAELAAAATQGSFGGAPKKLMDELGMRYPHLLLPRIDPSFQLPSTSRAGTSLPQPAPSSDDVAPAPSSEDAAKSTEVSVALPKPALKTAPAAIEMPAS